jgi:RNA polymerase sigma-70 factor, ECF subfamily
VSDDVDDEAVFRSVFEATYEDLLRFVERRVPPLAAEDVVAEVFLVAWRRLSDVPAVPEEARAWLFAVAQRSLANQRRGDARRLSLQVRIGQQAPAETISEDHSAAVAARVDLAHAWSRLSPGDQEVLTLTGLDQLTGPQAAQVLGISPTAFSLRLLRARRRLRLHLDRAGSRARRTHSDGDADTRGLTSQRPPQPQEKH